MRQGNAPGGWERGETMNPAERLQIASAGWDRRAPAGLAAIGAHPVRLRWRHAAA